MAAAVMTAAASCSPLLPVQSLVLLAKPANLPPPRLKESQAQLQHRATSRQHKKVKLKHVPETAQLKIIHNAEAERSMSTA
jgi:hypothetical protein